jgi:hypothetical protein
MAAGWLNKVDEDKIIESTCGHEDESPLASTYIAYQEEPREYRLSSINAVLNVHTRVSDLYNDPYDQVREQLRLLIESVKEKQESELLNNADYGLLNNVVATQKPMKCSVEIFDTKRDAPIANHPILRPARK